MINYKNKKGNLIVASLLTLSLLGMPLNVLAEEVTPDPTPTAEITPTPEATPTPEPTSTPTPEPTPTPTPTPEAKPLKVSLSNSKLEIEVKKNGEITATVTGEDGIDTNVTWKIVSGKDVIDIDTNGNKVTITGLKKGTAEVSATTTATEDGKEKIALATITVKEAEKVVSKDATLKKLEILNGELSPEFSSEIYEYTIIQTGSSKPLVNEKTLATTDSKAKVTDVLRDPTGTYIEVVVVAESGDKQIYKLNIEKEQVSLNLKSLSIKGYSLNETFSSAKTGYTVNIPYEAQDVAIEAQKDSENATIAIKGATKLKVGSNEVTITVKDDDGNSKVYTITVIRAEKTEDTSEDQQDEENKPTTEENDTQTATPEEDDAKDDNTKSTDNTLKYVLVTIGCLILFAIGVLGIYFYVKTSVKEKKTNKKDKKKKEKRDKDSEDIEQEEKVTDEEQVIKVEEITSIPTTESDNELEKTREFTTETKEIVEQTEEKTPTPPKAKVNVLSEIEDLFDDE